MTASDLQRVYLRCGRVAHLFLPWDSPGSYADALCGQQISFGESWYGTGNQVEHDRAATLPLCKRCGRIAEEQW